MAPPTVPYKVEIDNWNILINWLMNGVWSVSHAAYTQRQKKDEPPCLESSGTSASISFLILDR